MIAELDFYKAIRRIATSSDGQILINYLKGSFESNVEHLLLESGNDLYRLQGETGHIKEMLDLFTTSGDKIKSLEVEASLSQNGKSMF